MPRDPTAFLSLDDVSRYAVDPRRRLHSASHEEIVAGATTDVYFVRTLEVLRALGLADTPVVAEIFTSREGVLAGGDEVRYLLRDAGVRIEALPEGNLFASREVVMRIEGPYARFGMYETVILGMLAHASGWAKSKRPPYADPLLDQQCRILRVVVDASTMPAGIRCRRPPACPVAESAVPIPLWPPPHGQHCALESENLARWERMQHTCHGERPLSMS